MDASGHKMELVHIAKQANACFERADKAQARADDLRITAGRYLLEAKRRVEAGEPGHSNWSRWAKENIERSRQDTYKVMRLAASADENRALDEERQANRAAKAQQRKRQAVADVSDNTDRIEQVWGAYQTLGDPDRHELARRVAGDLGMKLVPEYQDPLDIPPFLDRRHRQSQVQSDVRS